MCVHMHIYVYTLDNYHHKSFALNNLQTHITLWVNLVLILFLLGYISSYYLEMCCIQAMYSQSLAMYILCCPRDIEKGGYSDILRAFRDIRDGEYHP